MTEVTRQHSCCHDVAYQRYEVQKMSEQGLLLGENFPHKVSAEYHSQLAAEHAVQRLVDKTILPRNQILIVQPHDPNMALKMEPEVRGIARTFAKSHVVLGIGGLVFGLLLAAVLVAVGPTLTRSSPMFTFIALGFLFTFLGLLLAGFIALRPDHDFLIGKARTASDAGQWTVIAHCADYEQQSQVKETLDDVAQTL